MHAVDHLSLEHTVLLSHLRSSLLSACSIGLSYSFGWLRIWIGVWLNFTCGRRKKITSQHKNVLFFFKLDECKPFWGEALHASNTCLSTVSNMTKFVICSLLSSIYFWQITEGLCPKHIWPKGYFWKKTLISFFCLWLNLSAGFQCST